MLWDCALKYYNRFEIWQRTVAEQRVKFQSDWRMLNINLAPLTLHEILG